MVAWRCLPFPLSVASGTPPVDWWAQEHKSGLAGLPALYDMPSVEQRALEIVKMAMALEEAGKEEESRLLRVVSIHWGPNWARQGESNQELDARRNFAHRLISTSVMWI
jgi:poly-gamma-glutamate capsule biosynthesis protein CapA/YwtB (metallophosphatase superfamily)